jgi:Tfp pilus assembly protein PilV
MEELVTKNRAGKHRAGFGLAEAMIALLLFGVFIAGACRLLVVSRESVSRASDNTAAVAMAHGRLERLQTFDFSQLLNMINMPGAFDYMDEHGGVIGGADDGMVRFRMTNSVTQVKDNLVMVTVSVDIRDRITLEWDGDGQALTTMIAEQR